MLLDDEPNLTNNSLVRIDGDTFDEWRTAALSSGSGPLRRPLVMLTFAADHAAQGLFSPPAIKAVNIAVHCIVGILVYLLCINVLGVVGGQKVGSGTRTLKHQYIAVTAALIWFLHPLHVSTVLYAVQRMAQFSTLFVLFGLLVFLRYRRKWAAQGGSTGEVIAAGMWLLLLTVLGALSKENGLLLPWLLVAAEVSLFRGRWAGAQYTWLVSLGWILLLSPVVLFLLSFLVSPEWLSSRYLARDFSLSERLMTQVRLLWQYISWLIFPDINSMGLNHDDVLVSRSFTDPFSTLFSLIAWLAAGVAAVIYRNLYPLLLFSLLFYLVAHSMESSFWPLEMVYEHRSYLPSVAVCLLLSSLLYVAASNGERVDPRLLFASIPALMLVFLFIRVYTWSDELRLSQVNLINHPGSARAHHMHANTLLRRYNNSEELGLTESQRMDLLVDARLYFEKIHEFDPAYVAALVKLYQMDSLYFPTLGKTHEWLAQIERLVEIRALQVTDTEALKVLFNCWGKGYCTSDREAAERIFAALYRRDPGSPGVTLMHYDYMKAQGVPPKEQIALLERAMPLQSDDLRLRYFLVRERIQQGHLGLAYEGVGQIMLADPNRWQLPAYMALFAVPGEGGQ